MSTPTQTARVMTPKFLEDIRPRLFTPTPDNAAPVGACAAVVVVKSPGRIVDCEIKGVVVVPGAGAAVLGVLMGAILMEVELLIVGEEDVGVTGTFVEEAVEGFAAEKVVDCATPGTETVAPGHTVRYELTRSSAVVITAVVGERFTEQVTQLCNVLVTWLVHKHDVSASGQFVTSLSNAWHSAEQSSDP